jgi:hypothetical protein
LLLSMHRYLQEPNNVLFTIKKQDVLIDWKSYDGKDVPVMLARVPSIARTNLNKAPKVLVLRDSFGENMAPFLNQSFKQVMYDFSGNGLDKQFIEQWKPDIVIFMFVERRLKQRELSYSQPFTSLR